LELIFFIFVSPHFELLNFCKSLRLYESVKSRYAFSVTFIQFCSQLAIVFLMMPCKTCCLLNSSSFMEKVTSVETNINVTRGQQEKWPHMKIGTCLLGG